ncbi:hypothetical protein [Argonema antarcticum]|uniref:hypothetical protein n=1 Tax=Argonema antarcticum TaxID=2942763 RepID=UPI0020131358|nr:hypothetical protein [Argonema antarcticum]MCL1473663.1 hypothetical protein [Argonema antarcticum A004/B2]
MNTEELSVIKHIVPDITMLDTEERIVLLAQGKGRGELYRDISEVISWLKAGNGAIPFVMFIDLENINIFKWDSDNLSEPVCTLNTAEVLGYYGLKVSDEYISGRYLSSLTESWLRDLVHHGKSETPPAEEQIASIGLLPLLKDGTVQPEVEIRIDPKLRYIVLRYYYPQHGTLIF